MGQCSYIVAGVANRDGRHQRVYQSLARIANSDRWFFIRQAEELIYEAVDF